MNKFSCLGLFMCLAIFFSCSENVSQNNTDEANIETLYTEVMEIHDDVMPKMSEINNSKDILNEKLSDIEGNNLDSTQVEKMKASLSKLKAAEDAMWDWMHSFSDNYGQLNTFKEKESFLTKERESISNVRRLMLESIEESGQFIVE